MGRHISIVVISTFLTIACADDGLGQEASSIDLQEDVVISEETGAMFGIFLSQPGEPCELGGDGGVHSVVGDATGTLEDPLCEGEPSCGWAHYGIYVYYDYMWHLIDEFKVYESDEGDGGDHMVLPSDTADQRPGTELPDLRVVGLERSVTSDPTARWPWVVVVSSDGHLDLQVNRPSIDASEVTVGVYAAEFVLKNRERMEDPRGPVAVSIIEARNITLPQWAKEVADGLGDAPVRNRADGVRSREVWVDVLKRRLANTGRPPTR
jgi:hypothetical protein